VTDTVTTAGDADDLRLLDIEVETMFVMSSAGRIERQNDPDCSPGPSLFFAGCSQGNVAHVHREMSENVASRVLAIAAEEPAWRDPDVLPRCTGRVIDLLSRERAVTVAPHIIYQLPNDPGYEHFATVVCGDSVEGERMLARFADRGMPTSMLDAGFKSVGDLWKPWCVAVEDDENASIAFAARIGEVGAEIGVYTFPPFRARGFAAAVTASWSSIPSLGRRALFYSTARSNRSSQRVAARLGLRKIGASVSIS
jgi:hypothetical protein